MSRTPTIDVDPRGEDGAAYLRRIEGWKQDLKPRGQVQTFLAEQAARLSWKLEKGEAVEAARTEHHRKHAAENERNKRVAEAIAIGHELVDPSTDAYVAAHQSWPGKPEVGPPPRPPELLVHLLRTTAEGCRWLAASWAELVSLIDEKADWGNADERKAIRLLGKTPDDEDDAEIRTLRLMFCVSTGTKPSYLKELTEEHIGRPIPSRADAAGLLRGICTRAMSRLEDLASDRERDAVDDGLRHGFDPSEAGKELRRQQSTTYRELVKTVETLMKMKKMPADVDGSGSDDDTPRPVRRKKAPRRVPVSDRKHATTSPRPVLGERVRAAGVRGPASVQTRSKTPHPASPPSPRVQGEGRLAQTLGGSKASDDGPMPDQSPSARRVRRAAGVKRPLTKRKRSKPLLLLSSPSPLPVGCAVRTARPEGPGAHGAPDKKLRAAGVRAPGSRRMRSKTHHPSPQPSPLPESRTDRAEASNVHNSPDEGARSNPPTGKGHCRNGPPDAKIE